MGCGCKSGTPSVKTYTRVNKASNNETCTYTLEELEGLLRAEQGKIIPNSSLISYLRSQINVYNFNCELFIAKIKELL